MRIPHLSAVALLLASACGGGQERPITPDESADLATRPSAGRTAAMPEGLDGSQWRWVEAHCTEGRLDLSARGYAAKLQVREEEGGLTLLDDREFAAEECRNTVVMRATLPSSGPDWQMQEVTRVPVPATRECFGTPEEPRPGEVRLTDGRLEVLVQRSYWCGGFEVRMVYERLPASLPSEDEIVRRYVAQFTLGNADAVAALFADAGSLLEPFTQTDTGDPYRHDGREAVERWYTETFATAPWRALRVTDIEASEAGDGAAQRVLSFEYMDPRLEEPLTGRTRFTIAAGEIFEAQIELTSEPNEREVTEDEAGAAAAAEGDGAAEG